MAELKTQYIQTSLLELFKLFTPAFYVHLTQLGEHALHLVFTHRWLLLCFKREFKECDVLRIWETCWSEHRTRHFHLFVCVAIVDLFGGDCVEQSMEHDEVLLYFSSLAMHMNARQVLMKAGDERQKHLTRSLQARGLLYQLCAADRLPCTLAHLLKRDDIEHQSNLPVWDYVKAHAPLGRSRQLQVDCVQEHGDRPCPYYDHDEHTSTA